MLSEITLVPRIVRSPRLWHYFNMAKNNLQKHKHLQSLQKSFAKKFWELFILLYAVVSVDTKHCNPILFLSHRRSNHGRFG